MTVTVVARGAIAGEGAGAAKAGAVAARRRMKVENLIVEL